MWFNEETRSENLTPSRRQPLRSRDLNKAEAIMVFSFVVPATAFETGDAALHRMHTRECGAAFPAGVEVSSLESNALQRQIVASGFVWDTEIAASLTPLGAMRSNVPASGAILGQEVGELMTQGSLNFGGRDFDEFRIQRDCLCPPAGESGGRPEPGVPFDCHGEVRATSGTQELAAKLFEEDVAFQTAPARLFTVGRGIR